MNTLKSNSDNCYKTPYLKNALMLILALSATAKSEDIDCINNHMIDSVRFEFVKREIFKGKGQSLDDQSIHTMEDFLSSYDEGKKLFSSETPPPTPTIQLMNNPTLIYLLPLAQQLNKYAISQ